MSQPDSDSAAHGVSYGVDGADTEFGDERSEKLREEGRCTVTRIDVCRGTKPGQVQGVHAIRFAQGPRAE